MPDSPNGIHVVARVDRTKGTGAFLYVTPLNAAALAAAGPVAGGEYTVRVRRSAGPAIDYPAAFRKDACGDPADDDTGSVELTVPNDAKAVALDLLRGAAVLATFDPGGEPPEPTNVRSAAAPGAGPALAAAQGRPTRPKVAWTPAPAAGGAALLGAAGPGPVYAVQVSTDDGVTWRTVGVGLATPEASLDPHLFEGKDTVRVRVIASNGFRTKTTDQTLAVKDL